jgi:hypothetical protein
MCSADGKIVGYLDNMSITEHTKTELPIVHVRVGLTEILAHLQFRIVLNV